MQERSIPSRLRFANLSEKALFKVLMRAQLLIRPRRLSMSELVCVRCSLVRWCVGLVFTWTRLVLYCWLHGSPGLTFGLYDRRILCTGREWRLFAINKGVMKLHDRNKGETRDPGVLLHASHVGSSLFTKEQILAVGSRQGHTTMLVYVRNIVDNAEYGSKLLIGSPAQLVDILTRNWVSLVLWSSGLAM